MLPFHAGAPRALISSLFCVFLLTGCLGGGSDSQERPDSRPDGTVNGQVLDPPVSGALVKLVSAEGNALSSLVRTDDEGRFSLQYRGTSTGARLVATGGRDSGTGLSFQGLSLSAPLADNPDGIVTPVTTLVAHLTAQGFSLDSARQRVAARLGLDASVLLASPLEHGNVQHRTVLLAHFQTLLRGEQNPEDLLWQAVTQYGTDLAAAARALAGGDVLLASTRQRLTDNADLLATLAALDDGGAATQVLDRATRTLVMRTLERYLSQSLDYTADTDTARTNLEHLADAVWAANRQRGLQPASAAGLNVVRYLLNQYGIVPEALDQAAFQVPPGLDGDENIPLLASRDAIDPGQALGSRERLGDDQGARRAYFFRSELSPYYRSEQLFEGVYDDNYLDPLYAAIAEGQARAGLLDDATRTLRTQVFSPRQRIAAFRKAGQALLDQNQTARGLTLLNRARDEFDTYLEGVGIRNIVSADAENVLNLVGGYLDAGRPDLAEATLAPLYDYVDLYADPDGQLQGPYYNINSALVDLAEAQVQEAENQSLRDPYYQQALTSTRLLQRWTDGLGRQNTPLTCAVIRTQYTARYAALFARLGAEDEARAATDTFAALLQEPCNGFSTSYTYMIAPVYGYREAFEAFERFLNEVVTPIPPLGAFSASEARKSIRAQQAVALIKNDSVQAAMDYLSSQLGDDLAAQLNLLTFSGGGIQEDDDYEMNSVNRYVINTLHDQNRDDLARSVSEAAWDLVTSDAFESRYRTAKQAVEQGCRKLAIASEYLGNLTQARQRMSVCAQRALALVDGADTVERYNLLRFAGEGLYHFDLTDGLPEIASRLGDLTNGLSQEERTKVQRLRLRLLAATNDADTALNLFARVRSDLSDRAKAASQETERTSAATASRELLMTAGHAADKLRGRTVLRSQPDEQGLRLARALEEAGVRFAVNDDGDNLSAFTIIKRINSLSTRNSSLVDLAGYLGGFDALEEAKSVAENAQGQARYDRLARATEGLSARDLFPGTDLATFDFDLDGRPDFFNVSSAQPEPGATPPLTLDDDIDGDGVTDDLDPTPYCGSCG